MPSRGDYPDRRLPGFRMLIDSGIAPGRGWPRVDRTVPAAVAPTPLSVAETGFRSLAIVKSQRLGGAFTGPIRFIDCNTHRSAGPRAPF